jgi:RimJ/RimL family protein N-acetyltransferase
MAFHLDPGVRRGAYISLEPFDARLKNDIRATLNCDAGGWQLAALSGYGDQFDSWWNVSTARIAAGSAIAFAIRDTASGEIVGTTSYLNIRPDRNAAEIGATFLHPRVRSGYVNPEAKLLMLDHAFAQGARRIEILTDLRNERSQAAIAKLGAVREGVLRRERETWTGHIRDAVIFSIIDLDWPSVKRGLEARLARYAQA